MYPIFLEKKNSKLCSHKYSSGAHLFLKDFINERDAPQSKIH